MILNQIYTAKKQTFVDEQDKWVGLTKHQEGWKKAEEGLTQSRDPVFNYILVTFQLHVIHFPMYIIMFLDKCLSE